MAELELRGVGKSFGAVEAVKDVNLSVADGEFVVLVGPSGCGKSTLLRTISGLEEVSAGQVFIGGEDVTEHDPSERGVAMVFQSYALYPHMTVEQNIGFGLRMGGTPRDEVASKVAEAARTLELTELLNRKPRALSGGQRQRVAIGRAIVRDPEVFLFDEPLSNLDAELRVQMRIEIAKLHQRLKATMIYVTHDQVEAMTLASRIVIIHAGRVEQVGTPIEVYDDPDNMFVAGFIGSPRMNFLDGSIEKLNGKSALVKLAGFGGARIETSLRDGRAETGQAVSLGVRPEQFVTDDGERPRLSGRAVVVEQLGGFTYIYAVDEDGTQITVEERGHAKVHDGQEISVGVDPMTCLLFDTSGVRL
jgi:lactose/L-arabinose transport system ATP-binding protein